MVTSDETYNLADPEVEAIMYHRIREAAERRNQAIVEARQHPQAQADPTPLSDAWEVAFDLAGPVLRILAYGLLAAVVVAQVAG